MAIDKEWLAEQEAINEQLRRRAEERQATARSAPRKSSSGNQSQAHNGLLQRSLAAAGRVFTTGG